ncbi:hypothetical protein [Corallococcus sp. AB011P]|uniref:hypothetical protein n=1 Tax=Corallococcus sp. AB011P TaxID=2316735 RepID=UPI0011C38B9C|nr:hypothetical protein [Corallococcus sp. AB011P]
MAEFQTITNLEILGVSDAGDLSRERVILKANRDCDLANYLLLDNTYLGDGSVSELNRHVYWFPTYPVKAGSYILLYSKEGDNRSMVDRVGDTLHVFYWGLKKTVWNEDGDAVTLVHTGRFSCKKVG